MAARAARATGGAPNSVAVLVDDLGCSDLGCYGSEIETPDVDALAELGVVPDGLPLSLPTTPSPTTSWRHGTDLTPREQALFA